MDCFARLLPCSSKTLSLRRLRRVAFILVAFVLVSPARPLLAEAPAAAAAAFDRYVAGEEMRLNREHSAAAGFLTPRNVSTGKPAIENLTPANRELPGALLHHWRGSALAPGVTAAQFEHLLRGLADYPRIFAPQVTAARVLSTDPAAGAVNAYLRLRQHHVLTVVLDSDYAVHYGALDSRHRWSISRSTRVAEIASPGTPGEHALSSADEHGFLWRLNTYWSWEERPDGLYIQIETISLTRSIPAGLGWAVRPFVESIPRESLEFTLRSACDALQNLKAASQGAARLSE